MSLHWKKIGSFAAGAAILAGAGIGGYYAWKNLFAEKTEIVYTLQAPVVGSMRNTIAATGTVEPEELVNVGAQVGGMVTILGTDANGHTIDYGSPVKAGMVLARIDDSLYRAEHDSANAQNLQAKASLKNAEAGILQAKAGLREKQASKQQSEALYKQALLAWERAQKLTGINARSEYESAEASYVNAQAALAVAEAGVASAEASVAAAEATKQQCEAQLASSQASLDKAKRNLDYCVISSPVDGVIIDRRVNVGQTVNSSMSAPSLFLIAKDLSKMQVWVSVNEADIGQVKTGQKTEFTVDAFPGVRFQGEVRKVRLNATMSQNVVTYVVEIGTDNSNRVLLPYLTANVKFILDSRENVLSVPNAALRFTPATAEVPRTGPNEKIVWVLKNGKPAPVTVVTGLNDGMNTEIVSGDIAADAQLVTGSRTLVKAAGESGGAAGNNPFMAKPPTPPGSKKK